MALVLYYYTLTVLLASALAAATCLSVALVSRKTSYVYAMAAFIIYFFDVALVMRTDVTASVMANTGSPLEPATTEDAAQYISAVIHPLESALMAAALIGCIWAAINSALGHSLRQAYVTAAVVLGACAVIIGILPGSAARDILFYSVRSAAIVALLIKVAFAYLREKRDVVRRWMARKRWLYITVWVLTVATVAENIIIIGIYTPHLQDITMSLPERNFAENMLALACMGSVISAGSRRLAHFYAQPPTADPDEQGHYLQQALGFYRASFCLTDREVEVLALIVAGKSNREISDTLVVSPSTVKAHVHNILKKTEQNNRAELQRHFWHVA